MRLFTCHQYSNIRRLKKELYDNVEADILAGMNERIVAKRELVERQRERILLLGRKHGATSIKLFGSAATAHDRADSDVDFLVDMEPGRSLLDLGGLQAELAELLGCDVDVVTTRGLRSRLRSRVLKEAVAI